MINSTRKISSNSTIFLIKKSTGEHVVSVEYESDNLSLSLCRTFSSRNAANDFYAKIDAQTEQRFLQLIFN